ncbi:sulfatase-like hydrolase/transferase [bacterium]|nr:sulfatase-like hydrolase/transferase [bacterium]
MAATRRDFLMQTSSASLALLLGSIAEAKEKPNILWIIAEDFCPELGCYGNRFVHSPNIDNFAKQGVKFTNAYTAAPVCSASRSGFMVGAYQTTTGAHHHRSHRKNMDYPLPGGIKVLTHVFREGGYFTANIKKGISGAKGSGKTDWNFSTQNAFDTSNWDDLKPNQPFFAQINFPETHRSFTKNKDNPVDPAKVELPPYYPDHPAVRKDWALYLDDVSHLDRKVGAVLDRLEQDGLADNTVVFFFGDHGRAHVRGKQWCYDAGLHVPMIVRWPGKLKPGTVNNDLVSAIDFAPTVLDIADIKKPNFLQGQNFLQEGHKRDYVFSARDRCDETVETIRSVRDKRYRYIRNFRPDRPYMAPNRYKDTSYPTRRVLREWEEKGLLQPAQEMWMADRKPIEELYDTHNDPHEIHNLAASPAHQDVLVAMRDALFEWMDETGDLGLIPEPELYEIEKEHGSGYNYIRTDAGRAAMQRVKQAVFANEQGDISELRKALQDKSSCVRWWASLGLVNAGERAKRALPEMEKALWDSSGGVRVNVALAMCKLGYTNKGFHRLLKELEGNENPIVRHYAALAFEELGEDARPALAALKKAKKDWYGFVQRVSSRIVRKFEYAKP